MKIDWKGEALELMPQKCIYLVRHSALLVADLHLGKINHFRKSGIPVPAQANHRNMELLIECISLTKTQRVIFLGDLFHSHYNEEWEVIGQVRRHFRHCAFELVMGNHDIMSRLQYQRSEITVHDKSLQIGNFFLTHEPSAESPEGLYNLAGHIHPGVRLEGSGKQSLMLPCFYFGERNGLLPAFGSFTGLARVRPAKNDLVYVVADSKIVKV